MRVPHPFSTASLAIAMVRQDIELYKGPLGSDRPSSGLKYCCIDIAKTFDDSLALNQNG